MFHLSLELFYYDLDLLLTSDESKGADRYFVDVPVIRGQGRYGIASVTWSIDDKDTNLDLTPLTGELTFQFGEGQKNVRIYSQPDEVIYFVYF